MTDLTIEKELSIGSRPTDVAIHNGQLYVALAGSTTIAVVDLEQKIVSDQLIVTGNPTKLGFDGKHLYYKGTVSISPSFYQYDLTNNTVKELSIRYNTDDFTIDSKNRIFYASSYSSGSDLAAYSLDTFEKLDETDYRDGYGFSFASTIHLDDEHIYFASRKLDKRNLKTIHGHYYNDEKSAEGDVRYVSSHYIFTSGHSSSNVFDKNTYQHITSLPFATNLFYMDNNTEIIYMFNNSTKSIHKLSIDLSLPVSEYNYEQDKISFDSSIVDWVYEPKSNLIYAVSRGNNQLLIIDVKTFQVIKEVTVGSRPTGVILYEDKLYIPLWGATKIAIINLKDPNLAVKEIIVEQDPYRIAVTKDKVFYIGQDQWKYLRVYDFNKNATEKVTNSRYYSPNLAMDFARNQLLLGGGTSALYSIDPSTYAEKAKVAAAGTRIIVDGNDVFYGTERRSATNLSTIYGSYRSSNYTGHITYVHKNEVYTSKAVFNKATYTKKADLPFETDLVVVDSEDNIIVYNPNEKSMIKVASIEELNQRTLVSIEVLNKSINLVENESEQVIITGFFADNHRYYLTGPLQNHSVDLSFRVSDPTIASIDKNGVVTAQKEGSSSVSIYHNGKYVGWINVYVTKDPKISKVTINGPQQLIVGSKAQYQVLLAYQDDVAVNITSQSRFRSSNTNVATITPTGLITAINPGQTLISFSHKGESNAFLVIVLAGPKFEGLYIEQPSYKLTKGATNQTMAVAVYTDRVIDVTEQVMYTSKDTSVATVNRNGLVTGVKKGMATITLTYLGETWDVRVEVIDDVQLNEVFIVSDPYYYKGETDQLGAIAFYTDGNVVDISSEVKFESSSTQVIGVDTFGNLIALNTGLSTIKASYGGMTGEYIIVVRPNTLQELRVEGETVELANIGATKQLTVFAEYEYTPDVVFTDKVTYSSTDTEVVTVTPTGLLTGQKTGAAYILVEYRDYTLTVLVKVGNYQGPIPNPPVPDPGQIPVTPPVPVPGPPTGPSPGPIHVPGPFPVPGPPPVGVREPLPERPLPEPVAEKVTFKDMQNHWARSTVEAMVAKGIIKGVSEDTFAPQLAITRAEFAVLLARALELPIGDFTQSFSDVPKNAWYALEVEAAQKAGIITGSAGKFEPKKAITREAMATMIIRALEYKKFALPEPGTIKFHDASEVSVWARDSVAIANELGIITGMTATKFFPSQVANRAQAAVMVYRLLDTLSQ